MLDFVPNHTALDHPWVEDHPEHYVIGTELDLARAPHNYTWVKRRGGDRLLAYGRDPYFPGWPDALQLNYGNPATQDAMLGELLRIAGQCDGVRCDMAMLVLPEVFERTWGIASQPFWPKATRRGAGAGPRLLLHGRGLLGPRMDLAAAGVRLHLRQAAVRPAPRPARRAGARPLPRGPGLPGQAGPLPGEPRRAAGRRDLPARRPRGRRRHHLPRRRGCGSSRRGSSRAARNASRPTSAGSRTSPSTGSLEQFYDGLLAVLRSPAVRDGRWQLLECAAAWDGNWTRDGFVAFAWQGPGGERMLVAVNYADNQSQCYVRLPFADLGGKTWRLRDLLGPATYDRDGDGLETPGLFLDMKPMSYHAFEVSRID